MKSIYFKKIFSTKPYNSLIYPKSKFLHHPQIGHALQAYEQPHFFLCLHVKQSSFCMYLELSVPSQ